MRRLSGTLLLAFMATILILIMTSMSFAQSASGGEPPAPAVLVAKVEEKNIADQFVFYGRVEATARVQINARIEGYLAEVAFVEGSTVKEGQLLFKIEKSIYEANVAQARANLASAVAASKLAKLDYERSKELVARKTVSQAQLDKDLAQYEEAQANVAAQKAQLSLAEIDLGYTEIRAPIDGRIGKANETKGSLVGPSGTSLALLVAQDPIHVAWPVPDRLFLEVSKSQRNRSDVNVKLKLADGTIYDQTGRIIYADPSANETTNTITVRAEFSNPKMLLVDQQLVSVIIENKETQKHLVIPQDALLLDQQGPYVFVVSSDNKVEVQRITTGAQQGLSLIVTKGLKLGDRVIVAGQQKVRSGITVTPKLADQSEGN
ncbi:efflux RND transporter periplasmic adaptor subunit [Sneathiella sp. HT1-7]|uniref:efflux RND transporter periplasmic adaptor subunit n=1 Tax=Sneathiella sp. HT1-7 TaxID=2887192 RepID=UPI001D14EAE2|nr:efflux RND transporter periplasmic adaptor subunit [Sneathiella sp. HT1-7]MCC3303354.1 efflux RND transporter periplasmic adaptor subunit [Sneathiella sp. HT1-7]